MRSISLLLIGISLAVAGDAPAINTLSDEERAAGFRLLFDGASLTGWRGYKTEKPGAGWVIEEGVLTRKTTGGDLMTVDQFDDFELRLSWRISKGGNSGLMYRVQPGGGAPYTTGPEVQILDNGGHGDGKNPLTSANACYAMYPATKDLTRPVGEWNEVKIIAHGAKVEHWCNGEQVCAYEIGSPDWVARKAKSKWFKAAGYAAHPRGHIVLQEHGNVVSFHSLRIRSLSATAAAETKP